MLRVLIVTVTYPVNGTLEVEPECFEAIRALDPGPYHVDWLLTNENPFHGQFWPQNVALNLNKAREIVLSMGYEYLMIVESDVIIPKDALIRLMDVTGPDIVTCGLYRCRPSTHKTTAYMIGKINEDNPLMQRNILLGKDFEYGEVIEVTHTGFGCVLIPRNVLERIEFDEGIDVTFCWNCRKLGILLLCHTGVRCGHKDRDGRIYWA